MVTSGVLGSGSNPAFLRLVQEGGKAGSLIRKHDHYIPTRKMGRDVRAQQPVTTPKGGRDGEWVGCGEGRMWGGLDAGRVG